MAEKTDVIIVGGGLAGITAALDLLDAGLQVTLLDRCKPDELGGLARWSFGGVFFVGTPEQRLWGIKDNPEIALRDWHSFAEFGPQDHIPRLWAEDYVQNCTPTLYPWVKKYGVKFLKVVHWVERGVLKPGNSWPRFHMVLGTGQGLTDALIQGLEDHPKRKNLTMHFGYTVGGLIEEGGKVTGVVGMDSENNRFQLNATATVVATGGICGNLDRMRKEWHKPWGSPPEYMLNGSHPYADGAMHDATEQVGGNVTHLDKQWLYAAGVHHHRPQFEGHGLSLVPTKSALWVNYKGERIGPLPQVSGYDTRLLVEQILQQEKKYSWQVLNQKIAVNEFAISGSEFNHAIREKKLLKFLMTIFFGNKELVEEMKAENKDFVVANSLEELVKKMNALQGTNDVDLGTLKQEIMAYDAMAARKPKHHNDEQLRRITHLRQYLGDRLRTCKYQQILDPKAMPLIAIREFIVTRKTLGGIQTDLSCRVLTGDRGGHLEGLYAVGEAAGFGGGGMHGKRALEGTFLGGCLYTGRMAAKSIIGK